MTQLLAPYRSSMRLGQGFNSFTQETCIDKAVLPFTKSPPSTKSATAATKSARSSLTNKEAVASKEATERRARETTPTDASATLENQTQGPTTAASSNDVPAGPKAQNVTYSTRFVDKISDVTESMSASSASWIKTAPTGGLFFDTDKFNASDIRFHLQTKVKSHVVEAAEYSVFNKMGKVKREDFTAVYGDCFISGWQEGGELNAVITIKVHEKAQIPSIRAALESELSKPSINDSERSFGNYARYGLESALANLGQTAETTISVTWSGGGSIKDLNATWTIDTLREAAASFPDLVAMIPQRTHAVLTKYTSLADFQAHRDEYSPVDYSHAAVYTNSLLEHYMEFKYFTKRITQATQELRHNRASIELGRPTQEMDNFANRQFRLSTTHDTTKHQEVKETKEPKQSENPDLLMSPQPYRQANTRAFRSDSFLQRTEDHDKLQFYQPTQYAVFAPTFVGLIHARKACHLEMAKITNEIDLLTKNPKLAVDPRRDPPILDPSIFEHFLPVVRSLTPENVKLRVSDENAGLLLGYYTGAVESPAAAVHLLRGSLDRHDYRLQNSVRGCAGKGGKYLMEGCTGLVGEGAVHSTSVLVNDLETLDATFRLSRIAVWANDNTIHGICLSHAKGTQLTHGSCMGEPSHEFSLASDGSEIIVEVVIRELVSHGEISMASITFVTSDCNIFDTAQEPATYCDAAPPSGSNTPTTSGEATPASEMKTTRYLRPDGAQWSFQGLFSFSENASSVCPSGLPCTLGVIWSKDAFVPSSSAALSLPICRSYLSLGRNLQDNIKRFKQLQNFSHFPSNFILGVSASASTSASNPTPSLESFNALDKIDTSWTIKTIAFASTGGKLTGLKVSYLNGRHLVHGHYSREVWRCDIRSPLLMAKLTAGRTVEDGPSFVDTIEFICADERRTGRKAQKAEWPLDVATLRYLGEGEDRAVVDVEEVVERAPRFGDGHQWSVRGFYGEMSNGVISRIGVVWGRG